MTALRTSGSSQKNTANRRNLKRSTYDSNSLRSSSVRMATRILPMASAHPAKISPARCRASGLRLRSNGAVS